MSDTAERIHAAIQGITGLPADPTNEPTKENKQ